MECASFDAGKVHIWNVFYIFAMRKRILVCVKKISERFNLTY